VAMPTEDLVRAAGPGAAGYEEIAERSAAWAGR
jgi:hypothetical protein